MMQIVQVRHAKASLSALIEAAERGEPTTITRHGRPAAVLVPVGDAERLYSPTEGSLTDLLFAFPGMEDVERDRTTLRDVDV